MTPDFLDTFQINFQLPAFYGEEAKNKFSEIFKVELAIFDKVCHFNPDSASRASLISQVSNTPTAANFSSCKEDNYKVKRR